MQKMPFFLDESARPVRGALDDLDRLFQAGYRANQIEILDQIRALYENYDVVGYFLEQVTRSAKLVNMIGAQCYLLHSGEHYFARLNFWLPKSASADVIRKRVEQYFSIGVLHNHSFDFFTIGILGSGYYSEFYDCRHDEIDSYEVGSKIPLKIRTRLKLHTGNALFVTKSFDFHTQFEPDDFSVSLNFIPKVFDDVGSKQSAQLIVNPKTMIVERKFLSDPAAATRDEMAIA